ncbi:MAG: AraC family transcriptional regulator ligand-binding domain-containing protein [Mariniphaga sp.]|nr:AraC family transcriptional regulator ligand-binding domain-containing protein [Mariniphaga sp.]
MKLRYNYYVQSLISLLKSNGVETKDVYALIGIPEKMRNVADFELSIEHIHFLTLYVKEKIGIEHCGLKASKHIDFQKTGFYGPYALSCPTLKDAVSRIYAVHKEFNNLFDYGISPQKKTICFTYNLDAYWEMRYPETAKEIIEFAIANGVLSSRKLTRQNIHPEKIEFKHRKPQDMLLYEDIFGCPVCFNKTSNLAVYPKEIMDYEIPTYNPVLLKILDDFSKKTVQEEATIQNFTSEVRNAVIKLYHHNIPKEEDVALQINTSKSYLQKKLQKEGSTYKQILLQVQKEIALSYLKNDNVSIKETAWMLGYNDVSNFYRAFKKWTGENPKYFKK